jgi:hypothetical protein
MQRCNRAKDSVPIGKRAKDSVLIGECQPNRPPDKRVKRPLFYITAHQKGFVFLHVLANTFSLTLFKLPLPKYDLLTNASIDAVYNRA